MAWAEEGVKGELTLVVGGQVPRAATTQRLLSSENRWMCLLPADNVVQKLSRRSPVTTDFQDGACTTPPMMASETHPRIRPMAAPILTAVAWPYANGPRHIGHVSGFGVPSDVFSRYMRMAGHPVLMVSGTDEHGTPIQVAADKEGVSARELADRYNRVIVEDLQGLDSRYDLFTRTTTRNHYQRGPRDCSSSSSRTDMSLPSRHWGPSRRRRVGRCPIATSRAPAPSAATTVRGATSATTVATSLTRSN